MAVPKIYRGFSTQNAERTRSWSSYDVELVKKDLLNHFHTQIGERVMRPDFGCRIWDFLYEPLTDFNRDQVLQEVYRVCKADPRVEVGSVNLFEIESGLRVEVLMNFLGLDVMETFAVNFERGEAAAYGYLE